jgi:tRNA(Ile)-lysidine synthase TilS/MesJ
MALAYLCSRVKRFNPWFKFADHDVKSFHALIVDHGLRQGSSQEAESVAKVLRKKLDMSVDIHRIKWEPEIGEGVDPNTLPNMESLARRMRYRTLGRVASYRSMTSILLAHHEDDQAETVFMRLLGGHGTRGLTGMKSETDIPECSDLHGVYQSGYIDDLEGNNPFYGFSISRRQRMSLKREMRSQIDPAVWEQEMNDGLYKVDMKNHPYLHDIADSRLTRRIPVPPLVPMDIEDGGIKIYRPLLEFSKERLIATCVENDIPWFEDHTNTDPTLTMRNAVRHLFKNHQLPVALQKPAVLQLAQHCSDRVAAEDAEADRLLARTLIHDFEPNIGTLLVEVPSIALPTVPRKSTPLRRSRKKAHYTRTASILLQRLLSLVSPAQTLTPISSLTSAAISLFPSLSSVPSPQFPKPFTISGVHFSPLSHSKWLLSRAPYPSQQPRPLVQIHRQSFTRRWRTTPAKWTFSRWSNWALFDNRYWVSLRCRVPFAVAVAPYEKEHAASFRAAVGQKGRDRLDATLKRFAPGKVRYTLPAIYVRGDVGALIRGEDDWTLHEDVVNGVDAHKSVVEDSGVDLGDGFVEYGEDGERKVIRRSRPTLRTQKWSREEVARVLEDEKVRLVALPTVGVWISGVEDWVEWRFRYRKVEIGTLAVGMASRWTRRKGHRVRVSHKARGKRRK